ncbi:hypothetical protein FAZ19_07360 [Sphingobacterium alkalisoli]|uniref:IPT/TIG domain-containing protein n=2 Tax=Sphingobacterium TaxID=28453 RepID=A0A4U0NKD2_9SPHI|nr:MULTISPECIES: hypothetical protein [Sphingobacterium]TJY66729.1 hypothetical protein FAZ19_07360 [Sphingobacterium alkalisoli]TJZ54737.1 hypothetical protein FAZ15_14745 [Sphingobacterium olei]GGH14558.1 hypothetical protein GCM10011418_15580 [Sphingobacterium alkalisoli]
MNKIVLVLCLVTVSLFQYSCKQEEIIPYKDEKPTQVETLAVEIINSEQVVLTAAVTYLNAQAKVVDHGFDVEYYDASGKRGVHNFSLGKDAQPGKIRFPLTGEWKVAADRGISYTYYLRTEQDTTRGNILNYSKDYANPFSIHPNQEFKVYGGEKITLKGSFEDIKGKYNLVIDINTNTSVTVPFDITDNNSSLQLTLPLGISANKVALYLTPITNNGSYPHKHYLIEVDILGKLNPPSNYTLSWIESLQLQPSSDSPTYPYFQVIIGNRMARYESYISIRDYINASEGDSYRLGYYNGRDTVIFPHKLQILRPDPTNIGFIENRIHPHSSAHLKNIGFNNIFGEVSYQFGSQAVQVRSNNQGIMSFSIGNMAEGEYPITIISNSYTISSQTTLRVEKLVATRIDQQNTAMGSEVTIYGNFINGKFYNVIFEENIEYGIAATDGQLRFTIPKLSAGKHKLSIGYFNNEYGEQHIVPTALSIDVALAQYTGFSPKKGQPGSMVTLKGKSLAFATVFFGDTFVFAYRMNPSGDEVQIEVPRYAQPGKYKISAQVFAHWMQVDDVFEVVNP